MARTPKRRIGARTYRAYTPENVVAAVTDIKNGTKSLREASMTYGIPLGTLSNKIKGKFNQPVGAPTVFTKEEESTFIAHIITMAEWGFPFDTLDVQMMIKGYLESQDRVVKKFKNDKIPGIEWVRSFTKRHKQQLCQRMTQNISTNRASVSRDQVKAYFERLEASLKDDEGKPVPPSNIFNYDETRMDDNPGSKKAFFRRGVKYPERIRNATKTGMSVMFAAAADGTIFPPYTVYKADHVWSTWMEGGLPGARYNRSKSGWFDACTFRDWFYSIFVPQTRHLTGKIVLIGDNLASHFSPNIIAYCLEHNIAFVCLPANATHLTQPLDVAFFGPFKKLWRIVLTDWKKTGKKGKTLSKDVYPKLLSQVMHKAGNISETRPGAAMHSDNVIAGFKATGISPFDSQQVLKRLPQEDTTEVHNRVSGVVLDMLKEMRYGSMEPQRKRKMKLNVQPGKSVGLEDFNDPDAGPSNTRATLTDTIANLDSCSNLDSSSDSDASSDVNAHSDVNMETRPNSRDFEDTSTREMNLHVGCFVIVKVPTKISHKYYVAKILYVSGGLDECRVSYLRRKSQECARTSDLFVYPSVHDVWMVERCDIMRVLPTPQTSRRGVEFPQEQLTGYNLS